MVRCVFCLTVTAADEAAFTVQQHAICKRCAASIGQSLILDRQTAERVIRAAVRRAEDRHEGWRGD